MSSSDIELDVLPCGIFKVDQNRKVLYGNRYALNLLCRESMDTIKGLNIEDLVSYATRIFLDSYVYPLLLNDGRADEMQLSLKSTTGDSVSIVANIQMNVDGTQFWTFMSCANRDQLYNELLSARDTLQSQTANLTQINSQIQVRQSNLQAFCHSLSHDFTGPLRGIRQLIEIALEDLQDVGIKAPAAFKFLGDAKNNTDTLMDMTKGLVEYLVADVPVSRNELVDLEEIVSTVLAMREDADSTIPKILRKSLPTLSGNKAQIQVLFKNLIDNAIKYNENDPEITISYTENVAKGQIEIAIKDNGIGISNVHLEKIFTPFTRLNASSDYQGSGLGLSIVKKMVANHDGDIRVESTQGSGSTFYVSFPLPVDPLATSHNL